MTARAPRDRPDVRLFTEIGIISQLVRSSLERSLPYGLSYAQFGVLTHFARRGGVESPAQLARAFQVTKGAMTNTLQRLEGRGFIAIAGDAADGRRKRVSITPKGLAAHEAGLIAVRPPTDALRARFADADFEAVLPFLVSLREWLDDNR